MVSDSPSYTTDKMASVYDICYALISKRLRRGERVIFDASNYLQARRQRAINLAELEGAALAICRVQASQQETYKRLMARERAKPLSTQSDADWAVYQWMVEKQEPLTTPHIILDSSNTPADILAHQLYTYWMEAEGRSSEVAEEQSEKFTTPQLHNSAASQLAL